MNNSGRALMLIWLIISHLFFVASLAVCIIMWGFSGEVLSIFFYLIVGYVVCILLCALMCWVGFAKGRYRNSLLWSFLPYAWFTALCMFLQAS